MNEGNEGSVGHGVPDFSGLVERRLRMSGIDPDAPFPGITIRPDIAKMIQVIMEEHKPDDR
jgi:hypothetical protein